MYNTIVIKGTFVFPLESDSSSEKSFTSAAAHTTVMSRTASIGANKANSRFHLHNKKNSKVITEQNFSAIITESQLFKANTPNHTVLEKAEAIELHQ